MSVRFEGAWASGTAVEVAGAGTTLGEDEVAEGHVAVVFSYDEVFYVEGTPDELRTLLQRALDALPKDGLGLPALPEPPEVGEYGQALCPWEEGGEVCGERINLWDKDPVRRDLEWVAGAWVAGPSKLAENFGGDEEVMCDNLHAWALPVIDEWR